jgi:hypothetical protein
LRKPCEIVRISDELFRRERGGDRCGGRVLETVSDARALLTPFAG